MHIITINYCVDKQTTTRKGDKIMNYDKKIDLLQLRLVRIEEGVSAYRAYVNRNRNSCAGWTTEFVETILKEIQALAKFNKYEDYED